MSLWIPWPLQLETLPLIGKVNSKAGYCFTNILLVISHFVKLCSWVPESIWLPTIQRTTASIFGQFWLNADCRIVLLDHITLSNVSSVVAYYFLIIIICQSPLAPDVLQWISSESISVFTVLPSGLRGDQQLLVFRKVTLTNGCKEWVGRNPWKTPNLGSIEGDVQSRMFFIVAEGKKSKSMLWILFHWHLKIVFNINFIALRLLI